MEYVINKSFSQFQHNRELPRLEKKLKEIESEASLIEGVSIEAVEDFTKLQAVGLACLRIRPLLNNFLQWLTST